MTECVVTKHCFYLGKRCRPGEIVQFDGKKLPSYLELVKTDNPKKKYTNPKEE